MLHISSRVVRLCVFGALTVSLCVNTMRAADGAGPLLTLLKSGKLPKERQGAVLEMVVKKGNADDLAYVFSQVLDPKAYPKELRQKGVEWLIDAAKINKVKPSGDLTTVKELLRDEQASSNPQFALAAMRLAAEWQVPDIAGELQRIATAKESDAKLQAAAVQGLATVGDEASRKTLAELAGDAHPVRTRYIAVAALAGRDVDVAAKAAAAALAGATAKDDPTAMIQAFLNRQQGSEKLAAAIAEAKLPADVAKLALRTMYGAGRSDAALSEVLSNAAGVAVDTPPPSVEEVAKLVAEVTAKGDAVRGEAIFRRNDLNCLKCHAVSGGGGAIGPDLSPIGGTSPVDYVVNSILNPNLAIKELYVTKNIVTSDGQSLSGIVVDRNDQQVKIKDASGAILTIATADIDDEEEGLSLMPAGLTKFLTHEEFLDLAKFVSESTLR